MKRYVKKVKRIEKEIEKSEAPISVFARLTGVEKPTRRRAKDLERIARKTEITFTKKEVSRFDRFLTSERSDLF